MRRDKFPVFSVEGKMHSLHNLTVPLNTFVLTDEERVYVKQRMSKCAKCNRWKYKIELNNKDVCSEDAYCKKKG